MKLSAGGQFAVEHAVPVRAGTDGIVAPECMYPMGVPSRNECPLIHTA